MTEVPIEALGGLVRAQEVLPGAATPKAKPAIGIVHRALRAATRNDHAWIDRMLLPFNLNRTEDYRTFLNIHFAALVTLQADWRQQDCEDFEQMLRRVQGDLDTLGCTTIASRIPHGTPVSTPKGLGIAYVVRGSRLGSAVLRRAIVSDLPTSYLDFVPVLSWAEFLVELESIAGDADGRDDAIRSARSTFNVFVTEFKRIHGETAVSDHDG
jgi:heme oxygenase